MGHRGTTVAGTTCDDVHRVQVLTAKGLCWEFLNSNPPTAREEMIEWQEIAFVYVCVTRSGMCLI